MKILAKHNYAAISVYKLRLVAALIKNKNVKHALSILNFTNKKASSIIKKVLKSAIANAKNNYKINIDELNVFRIYANNGSIRKKATPRAKGRIDYLTKRTSHITIILSNK